MSLFIRIGFLLALAGALVLWFLTGPNPLSETQIRALPTGNAVAGESVFWAGGCASCHAAPKALGDAKKVLSGGLALETPFGTFRAPNISPHREAGIGGWTLGEFANAMKRGLRPDGSHYYPAFPFTSYARMSDNDVANLWAYFKTLPESDNRVADHDLAFPFNIRRGLGLWKLLYLDDAPVLPVEDSNLQMQRGRYLVEALGHCGECHTPRNFIGGLDKSRWLGGGVAPEGNEKIPNITPHTDGIGDWSIGDIADSLKTGFTPEFDSFGSSMADVQLNMAKLSDQDRDAIAAYLKAVPAVSGRP